MSKLLQKTSIFIFLVAISVSFFYKAFLGNVIVAGDFSGSDLLDLHLPFKYSLSTNIPRGNLPLWESDLALGFPLLAEGQSGPLYPPNILFSFLPPYLALNFSIIFSLALAGLFTLVYARALGLSRFSSLISGVTFSLSAFFITRIKHVNMIAVAAWVPFLFWATKKLFQTGKLLYAILIGVGIGLMLLAGHPQMAFFSVLTFFLYFLFELRIASKGSTLSEILPLSSLSITIAAVIAIGISAVQTLPTLEFTGLTQREEFTFQTATAYPFNPKNILTFISPYYFGNPATGSYQENIRTMGIFWENASYIGLLPLILAFWAILNSIRNKRRNSRNMFFIGLALVSLLLMLGRFFPLFSFLWNNFPGFQLFRFPTRFNLFLIFSLALLAGIGVKLLLEKIENIKLRPRSKESGEETSFSWPLKTWQTQVLILGFILVDLYVFATSYIGYLPSDQFLKEPNAVERLSEDESVFRVYNLTQYGQSPYSTLGWKKDQDAIMAIREAIPPNNNVVYDLSSFSDRGWFEGGLSLARRNRLENWLLKENENVVLTGKILGTFNVKYIFAFTEAIGIEVEKIEEYDLGEQFTTPLSLFENKQVIPRVLFVPEAEVIKDEEAVFERLISLDFLPTKTVILEKDLKVLPPEFTGALDTFREENPVTIVDYQDTEVVIEAEINDHGFLVLSDAYYPGWKVEVDGNEQEILPANYLVRAVELEPGKHSIRFFYNPLIFKVGVAISGTTLLIILFYFGLFSVRSVPVSRWRIRQKPLKKQR